MLCDSHQFDVGVSHFLNIFCQLCCQFPIIIESILVLSMRMFLPGTRMYFIDCHRFTFLVKFRTLLHPGGIFPFVIRNVCNSWCRSRSEFCFICVWICLIKFFSMISDNKEFVQISNFGTRNKDLIYSDLTDSVHWICLIIPVIKITDYRNISCIRCPDCKMYALGFVDGHHMRTKDTVSFIMDSCRKPRRILFGNDRSKPIGIFKFFCCAIFQRSL